jgi:hypothetical protein
MSWCAIHECFSLHEEAHMKIDNIEVEPGGYRKYHIFGEVLIRGLSRSETHLISLMCIRTPSIGNSLIGGTAATSCEHIVPVAFDALDIFADFSLDHRVSGQL